MALRYWVGGTGTWDGTTTTHWSTTSGGAGGASVPTATDDVFFDANSGGGTVTTATVTAQCHNFDATGFTGSIAMTASVTVNGPTFTLGSTMASTGMTGAANVNFVNAGTTVTCNGKSISAVNINASGGTFSQADAMSCVNTVTLTAGAWQTNNFSVTCGTFSSSNSNTRTLTLGSSAITLTTAFVSAWATNVVTGLTVTANTATVTISGAGSKFSSVSAFNFNGLSLVFSGSGSAQIDTAGATFGNVTRTGTAVKTDQFTVITGFTVTGTLTLASNSDINRLLVQTSVVGTQRTISAANVVVTNTVDFMDIAATGAATWTVAGTGATALGDCQGNSGITFTAPATQYRIGAAGNWSDVTHWSQSSGGANNGRVPLPQDNVILDSGASGTIAADMPRYAADVTITTFAGQFNRTQNGLTSFGSWTNSSAMTMAGTVGQSFAGRGTHTMTTGGLAFAGAAGSGVTFQGPGGTYTLQDALNCGVGSFTVAGGGTFTANNFNVTASSVNVSNLNAITVNAGTGTWTLTGTSTATVWNINGTGPTINASSATIVVASASTNTRTFAGGGKTYGTLTYTVANSPGALTVTGANTFDNLNVGPGRQLVMPASTTNTFNGWNVNGAVNGYLYLPGVASNYASAPDSAALDITSDIDLRVKVALDTWVTGAAQVLIEKSRASGTVLYAAWVDASGNLAFGWHDGTTARTVTSTATVVSAGAVNGVPLWVRATRVQSSGVVTFYTSTNGSVWTQLGSTTVSSAGTAIATSVLELRVGGWSDSTSNPKGSIYRAQVYNGIAGTLVFDADFTAKPVGANTFAESSSNAATVTINGPLAQAGDGRIALTSSTPGTQATIRYTGPGTATSDYLTVQDTLAVSLPTGSGIAVSGPTDSGTETEITAIASEVVSSDSATETEVASVSAAAVGTDSGTGSELSSLAIGTTDSAVENEVQTIAASVTAVDSGAESDLVSVSLTTTDTAAETEVASVVATPTSTDTGTGSSTVSLVADVRATDAGSVSEAVQLALAALDTASEIESTLVTALLAAFDSGSAIESVLIGPHVTDTGVGTEAVSLAVSVIDSGTETETVLIQVQVVALDTAVEAEAGSISAVLASSDAGVASEEAVLGPVAFDQALLTELASTLFVVLNAEDGGVETDVVLILGQMSSVDAGTWHEETDIAVDLHEHRPFIDAAEPTRMNDGRSLVALAPAKMRRL